MQWDKILEMLSGMVPGLVLPLPNLAAALLALLAFGLGARLVRQLTTIDLMIRHAQLTSHPVPAPQGTVQMKGHEVRTGDPPGHAVRGAMRNRTESRTVVFSVTARDRVITHAR